MKKLIILSMLLIPCIASASEMYPWSWSDTATQVAVTGVTVLDWGQTRYISAHPTTCFEANPILGVHPSLSRVDTYFPVVLLLEFGAAYLAPEIVGLFGVGTFVSTWPS